MQLWIVLKSIDGRDRAINRDGSVAADLDHADLMSQADAEATARAHGGGAHPIDGVCPVADEEDALWPDD